MSLYSLAEDDFRRVLAEPSLVESLLGDEAGSRAAATLPRRECDIDKSWHAIHFILTGTIDETPVPLGFLLCGGQEVGDDIGYGPARVFDTREVSTIADALETFTLEAFEKRFDHPTLVEESVYAMADDDENDDREYVMSHFAALREFVIAAKAAGAGLVVALC